ncbi:hypothetical protein EON83_18240 [bacterium]|nr:MAG: hypothetical protein EON83_18240 [bacterium]
MNEILDLPPFPRLTFRHGWNGHIRLESWMGYRASVDSWDKSRLAEVSNGSVHLYIDAPENQQDAPPSLEPTAAYIYLLENEQAIHDSPLKAIFEEYPERREAYGYDETDDMPVVEQAKQFKQLIGLSELTIFRLAKEGVAYIQFGLRAAWDGEHGFNVTMHKDRAIQVGNTGDGDYHAERDIKLGGAE